MANKLPSISLEQFLRRIKSPFRLEKKLDWKKKDNSCYNTSIACVKTFEKITKLVVYHKLKGFGYS